VYKIRFMIFEVIAGENSKYPGVFDGGFTINRSGSTKEGTCLV